jgi:hypothetical protein
MSLLKIFNNFQLAQTVTKSIWTRLSPGRSCAPYPRTAVHIPFPQEREHGVHSFKITHRGLTSGITSTLGVGTSVDTGTRGVGVDVGLSLPTSWIWSFFFTFPCFTSWVSKYSYFTSIGEWIPFFFAYKFSTF